MYIRKLGNYIFIFMFDVDAVQNINLNVVAAATCGLDDTLHTRIACMHTYYI